MGPVRGITVCGLRQISRGNCRELSIPRHFFNIMCCRVALIYLSTTLKLHGRYELKNAKYRQRELLKKLILVAFNENKWRTGGRLEKGRFNYNHELLSCRWVCLCALELCNARRRAKLRKYTLGAHTKANNVDTKLRRITSAVLEYCWRGRSFSACPHNKTGA